MTLESLEVKAFWAALDNDQEELKKILPQLSTKRLEELAATGQRLVRAVNALYRARYETRPPAPTREESIEAGHAAIASELDRLRTFQQSLRNSGLA